MILFWQEVKECYTSATYLHEKTFRNLGSGFVVVQLISNIVVFFAVWGFFLFIAFSIKLNKHEFIFIIANIVFIILALAASIYIEEFFF